MPTTAHRTSNAPARPHPRHLSPRIRRILGLFGGTIVTLMLSLPAVIAAQSSSTASAPAESALPPVLQKLVQAGRAKVLRRFPTAKPGLTGYVVHQRGHNTVVFGEDGYLIVGPVLSPQGDDLSRRYGEKYLPKPDVAATVDKLEHSGQLVVEGAASAPVLYVFADPNCIFCHRFYKMTEPLVQAGHLQLRWVMVGFLKPSSIGRAAAILAADDPVKALHTNELHFDVDAEEGGLAPDNSPSPSLRKRLQLHSNELHAVGGTGTPTLLYRTGPGKWAAAVGLPPADWFAAYAAGKPLEER